MNNGDTGTGDRKVIRVLALKFNGVGTEVDLIINVMGIGGLFV